jgi:hypothetical protein
MICPFMLNQHTHEDTIEKELLNAMMGILGMKGITSAYLDKQVFQTVKVQLMALGLVNVQVLPSQGGGSGLYWSLTKKGNAMMYETRAVRTVEPAYKK